MRCVLYVYIAIYTYFICAIYLKYCSGQQNADTVGFQRGTEMGSGSWRVSSLPEQWSELPAVLELHFPFLSHPTIP